MTESSREDRLRSELECLKALKRHSSIFDFEFEGDPPEMFTVSFAGKGIVGLNNDEAEFSNIHQVQIQMAYLFPNREPDLKWLTPIFHPNVSNSGFVDMDDIGLVWSENLSLEIICERLWDVVRLAHLDLEKSSQLEAKNWFKSKLNLKLPIDVRPLRDRSVSTQSNVVQYSRRNPRKRTLEVSEKTEKDILFIGDEHPAIRSEPLIHSGNGNSSGVDSASRKSNRGDQGSKVSDPRGSDRKASAPQPSNGDDDILFID